FVREAAADGVALDPSRVLAAYHEVEPDVEASRYRPYREVLSETALSVAGQLGWKLSKDRATFLADSLPDWRPFPDVNPALVELVGAGNRLGILSNVDDDLLGETRRHFPVAFDVIVTAQQVRSDRHRFPARQLQPDAAGRPQCDRRERDQLDVRCPLESEAAGDGREDEHGFHRREAFADADARAASEREVDEPRQPRREPIEPAFRKETLRTPEPAGIAVHDPGAHVNRGARRHPVTADLAIRNRFAPEHVRRRIEPDRFLHDRVRIGKFREVVHGRRPPLELSEELR